jgi:hypothetical protein
MCIKVHYQNTCGCASATADKIRRCKRWILIGDWEMANFPDSKVQIEICMAICIAESSKTYRTEDGNCPACERQAEKDRWKKEDSTAKGMKARHKRKDMFMDG